MGPKRIIIIFNIFSVNSGPSDLINYSVDVLFYTNYSIEFYAQLIVNIDFRKAYLKLLNLRVIGLNVSDMGSTSQQIGKNRQLIYYIFFV